MATLTVFVPLRVSPKDATVLDAEALSQQSTRSNILRTLIRSLSTPQKQAPVEISEKPLAATVL